jgi:hypothetical protein
LKENSECICNFHWKQFNWIQIEFKHIEWNTYLIELNTILFSFGFIRLISHWNLNWIQTNFNSIWCQFKPKSIEFNFFHNLAQFNQIMKFQVLKAHVYLTSHIYVGGLAKGAKWLGLEFHIKCFHNCRVDDHTCRNPNFRLATKTRACEGVGQEWA